MPHELAVVVSTFERPDHLERCLASLELQRGVEGRFEVVVTDDGSRDDTLERVAALARRVSFPLRFTTHAHDGFRLARCRNAGIAASSADYLLFTDGDCVFPPDHLRVHLEERRRGFATAGDCLRLDRATSARMTLDLIQRGDIAGLVPAGERRRLRRKAMRAAIYQLLRVPMRPRLSGNNIGAWRIDLECVNGFDERFVGWGFEDRDLQRRLAMIGVRPRSVLSRTAPIHLWHEPHASFSRDGWGTANRAWYSRRRCPAFCVDGLVTWTDHEPSLPLRGTESRAVRRAA